MSPKLLPYFPTVWPKSDVIMLSDLGSLEVCGSFGRKTRKTILPFENLTSHLGQSNYGWRRPPDAVVKISIHPSIHVFISKKTCQHNV